MSRRLALVAMLAVAAAASPLLLASDDARAQGNIERPWLGIAMDAEGPHPAGPGVRVGHVVRGSPAEKAGLHEGDRVVRIAGNPVTRGADVVQTVAGFGVGDSIDVVFLRAGAGKEQTAHATLAAFPAQDQMMRMDLVGTFAPAWKDVEVASGSFPQSISSLRGRVVLLDFWATWCAPCRVVIPKLDDLQSRYGAQGLIVLGVSTEETQDVALFAHRMAMHYGVASDRHGQTSRTYGVVSLPTLVVIDKRGVVRDVSVGYDPMGDARLDAMVRSLLAEPAPTN
ncbi:MAG TPA: redoxin domain-containing protein [Polyangiaceae bacterium]